MMTTDTAIRRNGALEYRVVQGVHRVIDEPPNAGPGKDSLGDGGTAHHDADLHSNDGDGGDQGVFQGVDPNYLALTVALGVGSADVVLPEDIDHAVSGVEHRVGQISDGQGHRRQD